jgi:spheroidene monooxygenase
MWIDRPDWQTGAVPMQTVTLTLARFPGPAGTAYALWQMAAARRDLARDPAVGFWKLCGSGTDGSGAGQGFTPRPNWHVWGILATFADRATAEDRLANGAPWRRWRAKAAESCAILMTPLSTRGRWSGRTPFEAGADPGTGPLAVLTRASVRPAKAVRFWRQVPRIQSVVNANPAILFGIGLGEIPLVHQITFSVWPDPAAMTAFARGDGPHAAAIRAVREGDWFSEELYARFRVTGTLGTWQGRDPLDRSKDAA